MSLIEKIDAAKIFLTTRSDNTFEVIEISKAKEIILSEQKEILTIGDKIRESNESLARHMIENAYSCEQCIFKCYDEDLNVKCAWGRKTTCEDGITQYLNQPYTE